MILSVSNILDSDMLDRIALDLPTLDWRDGRITAGSVAQKVKRNQQADIATHEGKLLAVSLQKAIAKHPVVKAAAQPRRFSNLVLSKTENDGYYGPHVDNAIMTQSGEPLRTDLSFTLFLNKPDDYDGGELIIHNAGATQSHKGDMGDLILYPSSSIHEVAPVTKGERIVCVGWIESLVADVAQREILFDLENLRVSLRASLSTQSLESVTLDKVIANLIRQWAVT